MRVPVRIASAVALLVGMTGLVSLVAIPPASALAPGTNWFVATTTIPNTGVADLGFRVDITGRRLHAHPDAIGTGSVFTRYPADVAVWSPHLQRTISSTRGAGSVDISFEQASVDDAADLAGMSANWYFNAGDTVRFLFFETDAVWTDLVPEVLINGVSNPVTLTVGSGATAVVAADSVNDGIALMSPAGVAGSAEIQRSVNAGVVGAVTTSCVIGDCVAGWHAPDGRADAVTMSGNVIYANGTGHQTFVGPRGDWSFDWSGVSTEPILAAYAPVGGLWPAFT